MDVAKLGKCIGLPLLAFDPGFESQARHLLF